MAPRGPDAGKRSGRDGNVLGASIVDNRLCVAGHTCGTRYGCEVFRDAGCQGLGRLIRGNVASSSPRGPLGLAPAMALT